MSSGSSDCAWYALKYFYQAANCTGAPVKILIEPTMPSEGLECASKVDNDTGELDTSAECAADSEDWSSYIEAIATEANYKYLLVTVYLNQGCTDVHYGDNYVADGRCQVFNGADSQKATVNADGTATYEYFGNSTFCTGDPDFTLTSSNISDPTLCGEVPGLYNGYHLSLFSPTSATSSPSSSTGTTAASATSAPTTATPADSSTSTSNSGSNTTAIAVGVSVAAVVVAVVLGCLCWRKRRSQKQNSALNNALLTPNATGLWNDPVIIASRIPRDKLQVESLLSRGGYGEVRRGVFDNQAVAVKMLLPSHRNDLDHVNAFLGEAKLTASLEHPRIVQLVGIAWNSFKDLCVVLEFADGGDLRSLLETSHIERHPMGFDADKVRIALHVSHALTYLHSLDHPVLHRDLKSRNILLSKNLDAKLTDFGVSREIVTDTMTVGIGSSLWMAPEVMTGGRYDEKADVFSFGVVLSELDTQMLPYRYCNDNSRTTSSCEPTETASGRSLPNAVLIQRIVSGQLQAQFSDEAETHASQLVTLGRACIAMEPKNRPKASEALFCLHKFAKGLQELRDSEEFTN